MEGHHRRDGLLEERGCVEKGPVSAEADDEVDFVRQIVLLFVERHQLVAHLKKTQSVLMKNVMNHEFIVKDSTHFSYFSNPNKCGGKMLPMDP